MKLTMFDVDGTLTNSNEIDAQCFVAALKEAYNVEVADIEWSKYKCVSDQGLSTEIFEDMFQRKPEREDLNRIKNSYLNSLKKEIARSKECCPEIPGAVSAMQRLKENPDYAVAIATGCWKESADLKLTTAGFEFNDIPMASSSDSMERVTIMQISLERAITKYRVDKFEKVIYVGDGVWNVIASRELNFHFIGVGSGANKQKLLEVGARNIVTDFCDYEMFMNVLI